MDGTAMNESKVESRKSQRPNDPTTRRPRRGLTYVELLVAVFLVSIAAASAGAVWVLSARIPAVKRVTELGSFISVQEIERQKAKHYSSFTNTPDGSPMVDWYDRNGRWLQSGGTAPVVPPDKLPLFQAKAWTRAGSGHGVNRDDPKANIEDLVEIYVEVWSGDGTRKYETAQTLVTFGGL
jgi:type II secretory pathway pseudopilin PulG